ncbi:HNH endonuclease [Chryseobacterium gambrini]|nr:HNH endonuclease [Chryseobacterium gambrini]MDN4029338.1 HNH endonuclease [Chryseobacterium gambrini]
MPEIITEIKFLSKGLLREANIAAHREKRDYCIDPELLEKFPLDFIYYVTRFHYHKKNELRLFIKTPSNEILLLDVSITRYESLPSIIFFDNDTFDIKINDRPYPNHREWQETEVLKPVRKQAKFRKNVLQAYNNNCAVCNIKDERLLRAAHIVDVRDGGNDEINNGICLCVNHEIAFDRGLLQILDD